MEKDRSTKELLQVMLDNKPFFMSGLCSWVDKLECNFIVNSHERRVLSIYIRDNKPSKWSSIDAYKNYYSPHYWCVGNIKLRLKWIKKHIKKLSK